MKKKKALGTFDIVLYVISALLFLDQLTAAASVGPQSIFWLLLIALIYVTPYIMIVTELATAYPNEGGIYDWVMRAFGPKAGAHISWLYWINMMLFVPTGFLLFAGVFSDLFMPELGYMEQSAICLVLVAIMTVVLCMDIKFAKWLPNIGAILKIIFILSIAGGGIYLGMTKGPATEFSASTMTPAWGAGIGFLAMIVFNVTGWDTIAALARHIENPAKSIPRGFAIAGVIVVIMYLLAMTGVLVAVPVEDLGLIAGFVDTLQAMFNADGTGWWIVVTLGCILMFSLVSNNITWCMAANEAAMAAGRSGELPKVFGYLHPKTKAPMGAALLGGVVASVEVLLYGLLANTAEYLFWLILAFSTMIFFIPYLVMFISFVRLRRIDPDAPRPFRVPGGMGFAKLLAMSPFIVLVVSMYLLLLPPGEPVDGPYVAAIVFGCLFVLGLGKFIVDKCCNAPENQLQAEES
ncbi:MAG: APC family permease [Xanthomonadales bacterium]|jgi:amino acid transporter|nr:APC family permease [Xanthomonadales bacterium]